MAEITIEQFDLLEQVQCIRKALLIGLESFGEIERVLDRFETIKACGGEVPDTEFKPLHPTGAPDTIGVFASALRTLELLEPDLTESS